MRCLNASQGNAAYRCLFSPVTSSRRKLEALLTMYRYIGIYIYMGCGEQYLKQPIAASSISGTPLQGRPVHRWNL